MKKLYSISILLILTLSATAQRYKNGVFISGGFSQMTLSQNKLSDEVFARQGTPFATGSFGIMASAAGSRDQPSRWLTIQKAVLFEASLCRCGGNIELITTLPNGSKTLDELKYIQYQGNFSPKIMLGLNRLQFLLGPNLSTNFYSGVEVVKDDVIKSAKNQFNLLAIGYEFGMGVTFGKFMFSGRYRGYFTAYGQETTLIPTEFGNTQIYFALSWFYSDRNIEKNNRSIFWD